MEAVIGSRGISGFNFSTLRLTHVISGGATGIDTAIRKYCLKNSIPLTEIKPDYQKYPGKVAPIMRNRIIVQRADVIYAIWDGNSRGTKDVIDYANKLGKQVIIKIVNNLY